MLVHQLHCLQHCARGCASHNRLIPLHSNNPAACFVLRIVGNEMSGLKRKEEVNELDEHIETKGREVTK
jgi:hypothetical protein